MGQLVGPCDTVTNLPTAWASFAGPCHPDPVYDGIKSWSNPSGPVAEDSEKLGDADLAVTVDVTGALTAIRARAPVTDHDDQVHDADHAVGVDVRRTVRLAVR